MRKLLGVLLAGALVLGACADGGDGGPDPSENPKEALLEAFRDLSEGDGVSMTLSIDSDEGSLQAMAAEDGTELSDEAASTILDSSITFGANSADDPADGKAEILFDLGGEEAAALVVDGYDLYAHADVRYILETFGQDPSMVEHQLKRLPPELGFVNQAVEGEWIQLTGLEQLAQQAEQSGQEGGGVPNLGEQQQEIVNQLSDALDENSEVTEGDEEGPGTHLEAEVDVRGFTQALQEIQGSLGQLPGGQMPTGTEDLPEGDFVLDTWVEDGSLTQVRVDFLKNAAAFEAEQDIPEGVEEFAVLVGVEEFDGEVETPDDAVQVSIEQIMGALFGAMGGSMGGETTTGGATNTDQICEAVAELPADQQEAYKDICPDL